MPRDDRVQIQIRLAPDLADRLKAESQERDLSVNWLVTRAIEDFLRRLIPAAEWTLTRQPSPSSTSDASARSSHDASAVATPDASPGSGRDASSRAAHDGTAPSAPPAATAPPGRRRFLI